MTGLERGILALWMMGSHIAQSSLVKRGEIVLCKNGKPVRYAPIDIDIDWDEKNFTYFIVANESYDLVVVNNDDYDSFLED